MSDDQDDYLWTGEGGALADVAALERELRTLAWTPRPLALPVAAKVVPLRRSDRERTPRVADDARGWTPILAAVAAAAAVLAVLAWLRSPNDDAVREPDTTTIPAIQPTGRPSPDLKDPFANDSKQAPSVAPNLVDPFGQPDPQPSPRRQASPDLKDPFYKSTAPAKPPASPAPISDPDRSADLVDPFGNDQRDRQTRQRKPGKLYDPFSGKQADPPPNTSPDLKDPFKR